MATAPAKPISVLDRFFHISERGSTIGNEVRGGLVTFVTMAYIVILNPLILSTPDVDGIVLAHAAVAASTALTAGVMTLLFGIITRLPFAFAAARSNCAPRNAIAHSPSPCASTHPTGPA